uniref:Uncharacterized protein n=1 Tax=Anguilla anguilla TaxID=7936 RepID=A0A0E9XWU3_ANGAN
MGVLIGKNRFAIQIYILILFGYCRCAVHIYMVLTGITDVLSAFRVVSTVCFSSLLLCSN